MLNILEFWKTLCYNICGRVYEKEKKEDRNMINVLSLSNHIISMFEKEKVKITNLKLQKILYYTQGYFFKEFGREAFAEEIYSWQYGPVVPTVYYQYNHCGACPLSSEETLILPIEEKEKELIEKIVNKCKTMPSSRLVNMTHDELPWKNTNIGCIISKQSIRMFFNLSNPLGI